MALMCLRMICQKGLRSVSSVIKTDDVINKFSTDDEHQGVDIT